MLVSKLPQRISSGVVLLMFVAALASAAEPVGGNPTAASVVTPPAGDMGGVKNPDTAGKGPSHTNVNSQPIKKGSIPKGSTDAGTQLAVPLGLDGLMLDSALSVLKTKGFKRTNIDVQDTFAGGDSGKVKGTSPAARAPAKKDGNVSLYVYRGKTEAGGGGGGPVQVPSVFWLHWPTAQDKLKRLGLKWVIANVTTSGDSIGRVLAQDPDPGKTLNRGDTVKCDVGNKAGVKLDTTKLVLVGLIVVAVVAILLLLFRPRRPEPAQSYAMPSGKGHGRNKGRPVSPGDSGDDAGFRPAEAQTLRKVAGDWDYQTRFWASEFKKLRDDVARLEERLDKLSRAGSAGSVARDAEPAGDRQSQRPDMTAARAREPERKDALAVYNEALNADNPALFTGSFGVRRVGLSQRSGDGLTQDVSLKPKLTEEGTGMLWLVSDSGRTFVFPMQPLERSDQYNLVDVEQVFEIRKVSAGKSDRLVKQVVRPVVCRDASGGTWQVENKGEMEVFEK